MSTDWGTYDTDDTAVYDDDAVDDAIFDAKEYVKSVLEKQRSEATPAATVTAPTSADRQLSELRTKIANFDKAIAAQTPTERLTDHTEAGEKATEALVATVPLRGERQRLALEADRLSDALEWGFVGATDESLSLRAEDLALELEEASKQIKAVPVESLRSEADKARLAKAERQGGAATPRRGSETREVHPS